MTPGIIAEDIEIINAGHGGGTGTPAGGDDDGGSSGPLRPVPRRAYFTALQLGLAAIVMFFMALASSYIVRKGLGNDWQYALNDVPNPYFMLMLTKRDLSLLYREDPAVLPTPDQPQ